MVRTTYVVMTFLVAILLTAVGIVSLWQYVGFRGPVTDRHWIVAEIDDGNVVLGHAYLADARYARKVTFRPLGHLGRMVFASGTWRGNWRYIGLTLPLWAYVAVLFVYPAIALVRGPLRRRRRHRRNLCVNCGYDRAGNTSGVCPECGTRLTCERCGHDLKGLPAARCPVCTDSLARGVTPLTVDSSKS